MDEIMMYCGVPIAELSRDELIACIHDLYNRQQARRIETDRQLQVLIGAA